MLALAPVLVSPPPIVVADEPTLGLAPRVVAEVMAVFEELRDRGTAILLVEEKARDVLEIADRVAFLDLGHIVWSGPRARHRRRAAGRDLPRCEPPLIRREEGRRQTASRQSNPFFTRSLVANQPGIAGR